MHKVCRSRSCEAINSPKGNLERKQLPPSGKDKSMRRLLAPLLLVAIMASFPASLVLIFIRGIVSTANVSESDGVTPYYSACLGTMDSYGIPTYGGEVRCSIGVGSDKRSDNSLVAGMLFAHAITTHDVLPPSRYPMVIATTASIVASTGTTMISSPSSLDSGGDVGIALTVMAESSHSRGSSNYKPRAQARSTPAPGSSLPEPGSPLRQKLPELQVKFGDENVEAPGSSASHRHHIPYVAEAPPNTLHITVLGPLQGKSHSCAYSLVEFTNTHPNETIVLHSTYIEPMVVFPPGLASNHSKYTNETSFSSLRTFEGEYDQDRHMRIPPLTAITIPVSIIPHCRKPPEDSDNRLHHTSRFTNQNSNNNESISVPSDTDDTEFATTTNTAIDADIVDMILSSKNKHLNLPPTSNDQPINTTMLADIFDTLFVNTSWGIIQMKFPYTCKPQSSMEYDFNFPENLIFLDGGGGWYARGNTTPASTTSLQAAYIFGDWESHYLNIDDFDPFIHRLYMNNPADRELSIWEVYTTKPNLVDVEIQVKYVDSWPSSLSSLHPTMDVKDFYPLKGKSHPAKQNDIYVATLRLLPLNFTLELASVRQELGFLVVRTNLGTFNIALDFLPNAGRGGLIHGTILEKGASIGGIHLVEDYVIGKMLSWRLNSTTSSPYMSIAKTYHSKDFDTSLMANQAELNIGTGQMYHSDSSTTDDWTNYSFLTPIPEKIDFGTITTGSRLIRIPLNLTNRHTDALRVMRISIIMNTTLDSSGADAMGRSNKTNVVEIGVDFSDGSKMMQATDGYRDRYIFSRDFVFPPSNPESPLHVWCRFNASSIENTNERFYSGSILIRTSEINAASFSYHNWEKQVLRRLSLGRTGGGSSIKSSPYVLEIPFQGYLLLGNLGSRSESLLFPTRFSNLPVEERDRTSNGTNWKIPNHFDRKLEITNNFAVPITLTGISILDSHGGHGEMGFCRARFSLNSDALPSLRAESAETWKDLYLRYHFIDDDYSDGINVVRKCILSLSTDRAGKQSLPLIIYSGELFVDVERYDQEGKLPVYCGFIKEDGTTISSRSGIPCMKNWIEKSIEGAILQKTLFHKQQRHMKKGKSENYFRKCTTKSDFDPIDCYFRSLLSSTTPGEDQSQYSLQPIVVSFGAINAGESMTLSLFLTNLNHVPIDVIATTAGIGNMNVTIGVVPSKLLGLFEIMSNTSGKGDVAQFLRDMPVANEFISRFTHQFDIMPSVRARGSELRSLFQRTMVIDTFQNTSEYLSNYIGREEVTVDYPCGFLLSADGYEKSFRTRKAGKKAWTIPPGGVARFSIAVSAPERSELKNDVTQFVGTGLVLQTNHGQALPIVLTFSALAGQLRLNSLIDSQDNAQSALTNGQDTTESLKHQHSIFSSTVKVPFTLADSSLDPTINYIRQNRGVLLALESTFRHDLYLSGIRSCNRWFDVILHSNYSLGFINDLDPNKYLRVEGVENDDMNYSADERLLNRTILPLGYVTSMLACSQPNGETSFFSCALTWLNNRDRIQPPGCGLQEEEAVTQWMSDGAKSVKRRISVDNRIHTAKSNAIQAFRDVIAFLSVRYKNEAHEHGVAESTEAYVPSSHIQKVQHARNMWNEVGSLGLDMLTGQINAKTIYTAVSNDIRSSSAYVAFNESSEIIYRFRQSPLAIPMSSVLVKSKLEFPTLFSGENFEDSTGVVDFSTVHVADTAYRYVSIVNPSAMTVRVRLVVVGSVDENIGEGLKFVHVQNTPDKHHPWWSGASYWMSDDHGQLILASHNVTVSAGVGAVVSLLNPSLHTMSAFVLGCGNRCGLRNEYASNGDDNEYSSIGSGSGDSSTLIGRPSTGAHSENETPRQKFGMKSPPPFSFARFSNDIYIEPFGAAELGPVYFRPPGRGNFESHIYIENSITGFEEVKLRGRGGWENLVFLDEVSGRGGDVELRFGKSALVFPGSRLQGGTEQRMVPVVKAVTLANHGDIPVDITSVYMASSEVKHFTNKRRRLSSTSSSIKRCSARGFVLPGCDESFIFWGAFPWFNVVRNFIRNYFSYSILEPRKNNVLPVEVRSIYKNGFTLQPNQTQNILVLHYPDCIFQTSYSSVIFELGGVPQSSENRKDSRQQTFRRRNVELLVGYDMSVAELRQCLPYTPAEGIISILGGKTIFQVSPFVLDVLTFGLTRLTVKNGNQNVLRRPIDITVLDAFLALLLMALSFNLVLAVYLSTVPKFSLPSWKPTCRCLARADPTSSDLLSLGKEQTKHVLLSRFKKEGALASHCVRLDGCFNREKVGLNGSGTHSEAIFGHLNLVNNSEPKTSEGVENEAKGLLPCGLGWRTARKRGVGLPPLPIVRHSNDNILFARSHRVMSQRQETSASSHDNAEARIMGSSITTDITNENLTIPQPNVKPHVNEVPTFDSVREIVPTSEPKELEFDSNGAEDSLFKEVEDEEHWKLMQPTTSYPAGKLHDRIVSEAKDRRKQRDDAKNSKYQRFSRADFSKEPSQQVESSSPGMADLNQRTHPTKSVDSSHASNGKRIERGRNELNNNGLSRRKEETSNQCNTRQTRKPINGTKTQYESGATKKESDAMSLRKYLAPTKNQPFSNTPQSDADQPTSNIPLAQTTERQTTERQFTNLRPPPGLHAPPGFSGRPDLEGFSFPSSPSSSQQRLSSPEIQLNPTGIEIRNTPPQNSDFLSLLRSEHVSLANSLFQPPNPRTLIGHDLVLPFRSETFTPPIIELSPTAESNDAEAPDVHALLGAGSNFNVSNFLNGILSESTQCQQTPRGQILHDSADIVESDPLASIVIGVSLDPWSNADVANTNHLENILQINNPKTPIGAPLNSDSSSHLNFASTEYYSELAYARNVSDEGEDSDSLEPDSFYNQLLGED